MLNPGEAGTEPDACRDMPIAARVTKPVKQSKLADAITQALGQARAAEAQRREDVAEKEKVGPLRILLAEDGLVNQKLAIALLRKKGHDVTVANNGKEAVECVAEQDFDVILMDVEMPEMDGYQATAAVREREKQSSNHTPIIAMTAHAMKGDRERCLAAGMDAYVAKPVRAEELHRTIESVVATPATRASDSSASDRTH
jgi:CheY-like chemotaxis protein